MFYYGLTSQGQALEIASAVCDVLGHGKNNKVVTLIIETACQETHLGTLKDRHWHVAGVGLTQFDEIGVEDIRLNTGLATRQKVLDAFGVDIRNVQLRDLAFSPFLAILFCRLKYMRVPAVIPESLEGRAHYWKRHYNSELGAGSPEEYIENVRIHGKILEILN